MQVWIGATQTRLDPRRIIGTGGEADVYDLGKGRVAKMYKDAAHPDFSQSRGLQQAASQRLQEHQHKLRDVPSNLPAQVVTPVELVYAQKNGPVAGYVMPLIANAEPLTRLGEVTYRTQGVTNEQVSAVFSSLHQSLDRLHQRGVVIGDFNDLNVLVVDNLAWLIDADSMQFGNYRCVMFTERFVDPLHCDPAAPRPLMIKPHDTDSDWYAYHVMLFRSLLLVDAFGGVYRPASNRDRVAPAARPLKRISVFHPDVNLPRAARPLHSLPPPLVKHFEAVFSGDRRAPFPLDLLTSISWRTCKDCGLEFARSACPACGLRVPVPLVVGQWPSGWEVVERFRSEGIVLHAAFDSVGKLRVMAWHAGQFLREDGTVFLNGTLTPNMSLASLGTRSFIGAGRQLLVFDQGQLVERKGVDAVDGVCSYHVNGRRAYWIDGGRLQREGKLGPEYVGDVLEGRTCFWVGDSFGYGFYRAGQLTRAFVFDAEHGGINDTVPPPPVRGQIIAAHAHLCEGFAWVGIKFQDRGRLVWSLQVIGRTGACVAARVFDDNEDEVGWLDGFEGAAAGGNRLLVPSDKGIAMLDAADLDEMQPLPGSEQLVHAGVKLLKSGDGFCVVDQARGTIVSCQAAVSG